MSTKTRDDFETALFDDIEAEAADWADGYDRMVEMLAEDEEYARYLFEMHHAHLDEL